jgi:hypothetical protein
LERDLVRRKSDHKKPAATPGSHKQDEDKEECEDVDAERDVALMKFDKYEASASEEEVCEKAYEEISESEEEQYQEADIYIHCGRDLLFLEQKEGNWIC